MDHIRFLKLIADPRARSLQYRDVVRAYYDRITAEYRARWGDSFHLPLLTDLQPLEQGILGAEQLIFLEGNLGPSMHILDVGCGIGGPTLNLAEMSGAEVTGVNVVERQVQIARERAAARGLSGRVRFEVADAMALPFPDAFFDAVVVFESGCYMPDKPHFYRECARVLRPGGRFLGIDWMAREGLDREARVAYIEPICRIHAIADLIDLGQLQRYLDEAGLAIERCEDVTAWTGLTQAPAPSAEEQARARAFGASADGGLPETSAWLRLGGVALRMGARAGAFIEGLWVATRRVSSSTIEEPVGS
ncbi:MAG TPA: methyltransferase domain-containing protein [Kofleriaceae bacterium]|nr:methyltransferase domain-containing protein [Kofleriaceae bacterium]